MIKYDKLVRDKIPKIIKKSGKDCSIRILNSEDCLIELYKKLDEEVNEFFESYDIEEIADILEVIDGILNIRGVNMDDVLKIKRNKKNENGGFEKGIFLKSVF